jgi:class 3 adenylate cyclase/tetratricopeptide (TPR) repeat protein
VGRLLAFLVTDLVGSTEVLSRLGETRAATLQRTYFGLLRTAIASAGGKELKSFGDGMMAAFDTPSAAVGCAVAMQRVFERHNSRGGERLDVRIGIACGEAADEPERLDSDGFFGGPAVRAKRLCDAALGGQILVSDVVATLARPRSGYAFSPVGLVTLKGFPEPAAAFSVAYDRSASKRPALPPELAARPINRSPFVGRSAEWDRLLEVWADVESGQRRLASVIGEPGIGKTRLAAEFALEVYERGGVVLWGRSFEEALIPYQPFVQALRHYLLECDPDELRLQLAVGAAELARLVPELEARLGPGDALPREDTEGGRYRLFEAVASLLADVAAAHPVLVVLDDLQWADQATLLLLKHLAVVPTPASLLLLATYRDSEVPRGHPLAQVQADIERDSATERIQVCGLPADDVRRLVAALTGLAPPAELLDWLQSETAGNPFFVEELVHHLESTGLVTSAERLSAENVGVPARVMELVARRLQRLSPPAFEALRVASVIGSEFDIDVLASVLNEREDRLVELLDEAVAARMLVEVPCCVGSYGFSHALVQQALYEEQTANRRGSVHGRIAAALESRVESTGRLAELSHHLAAFGRAPEKVLRFARAAGEQALELLAYEDATREFARALDALAETCFDDRASRAVLLVLLGTAQTRAGNAPAALSSFKQAAELAVEGDAPETLARAALGYGGTAGFGGVWVKFAAVDEELVHFLEEALRRCSGRDNPMRVRLLGRLAQALYWSPDGERAEALSREALESARRLGDRAALAHALDSRHVALWGPDHLTARRALAREMLELGEQLSDRDIRLEAYAWLITDALDSEPIDVVDGYIEAHARVAAELRQPYHLWYTDATRAMRAHLEGRFADAGRFAEAAWGHGEQAHGENARQTYLVQTLFLSLDLGRLEELVATLVPYVADSPLPAWHAALALAYAGLDRREEALAEVERFAADSFRTIPRDCVWMATIAMLARVVTRFNAHVHAEPLYALLKPFAGRTVSVGGAVLCLGPVSHYLGRLARVLGDHALALDHLDNALAVSHVLAAPPLVVRTQAETAKVLLDRRAEGDAGRARALFEEAATGAAALGMAKLRTDVEDLLAAGASPLVAVAP